MCASIKEDNQRTTTLTDNKKRDYENEGSSMHEDSCIGINYAHAHKFTKCFRSLHTLLGFALYFVSSVLILVAVTIYSILTCTRIPCRVHTAKTGLVKCCLYTPRRLQQTAVSCKRSNCNKIENNKNKFVKAVCLRFYPKTEHNGFLRSIINL